MTASVIIATSNTGKLAEFQNSLTPVFETILSAAEAGVINLPKETGSSYIENALLKAMYVAKQTNLPTIADDSGLEVNALAGRPGIFSARFGGILSDSERVNYLLKELNSVPGDDRGARFVCAIAFFLPNGQSKTFTGQVIGEILDTPRGKSGFGYDPIFFCPELGKTFGEATELEKRRVSHRGKALKGLLSWFHAQAGKNEISKLTW